MKCNKCKKQSAKTYEECRSEKWFTSQEKYYCEDCFKKNQPNEYQKVLERIQENSKGKSVEKALEILRKIYE